MIIEHVFQLKKDNNENKVTFSFLIVNKHKKNWVKCSWEKELNFQLLKKNVWRKFTSRYLKMP